MIWIGGLGGGRGLALGADARTVADGAAIVSFFAGWGILAILAASCAAGPPCGKVAVCAFLAFVGASAILVTADDALAVFGGTPRFLFASGLFFAVGVGASDGTAGVVVGSAVSVSFAGFGLCAVPVGEGGAKADATAVVEATRTLLFAGFGLCAMFVGGGGAGLTREAAFGAIPTFFAGIGLCTILIFADGATSVDKRTKTLLFALFGALAMRFRCGLAATVFESTRADP